MIDAIKALQLAKDCYASSTTYVDSNYRKQWDSNIKMFQSKHPSGSKYNSESYKYRSRIFRPKTRSFVRKLEAATAAAFFANMDVLNVEPTNPKNPRFVLSAKVTKELLQYRLTKTIPWFLTVIGGMQDAAVTGVVCSYQSWRYRERRIPTLVPAIDPFTGQQAMNDMGQPAFETAEQVQILEDAPSIELIAIENLRIDPAASWIDPIGTSPYIIELMPMYAADVRGMSETTDSKTGSQSWKPVSDGELRAAGGQKYDQTRQAREDGRQDPTADTTPVGDFDIVWVHRNIMRWEGEDYVYYTLGTEKVLTDPVPIKQVYFTGERPYVMGFAEIETHKLYPSSVSEIGEQTQREINEVANSRLDNVKLVLNKRYIVKRGAQVDLKSLVRNAAGSITLANNPAEDIKELEWNDVTGSSYMEQDRLNVDYDEVVGNFSSGSVQTNRKLNETVGGMNLISGSANQMQEFSIRIFTETWVEPVLRQLANLEAHYETDETVMALVGQKVGTQVDDSMINQDLQINVNVGIGATDPSQRMNRLLAGVKVYSEAMSHPVPGLNGMEVGKEIFGMMGYRDGGRFITDEVDPRIPQLTQMVQELQKQLEGKVIEKRADLMETKMQLDSKERMHHQDWVAKINELGAQIELWQAQTFKAISDAVNTPKQDINLRSDPDFQPVLTAMSGMHAINSEQMQNVHSIMEQFAAQSEATSQGLAAIQEQMAARNANKKKTVMVNGKPIQVEIQ